MTAPEQVLWHNEVTEGFFKKRVVETQKITNYRVYQNSANIALSELDDIVIMNQHRVSQSDYSSFSSGRGFRTGFVTSKPRSKTIGDLVFIYQGTPGIIFKQIQDPQGIARLAKAARKRVIIDMKAVEKINKAQLQEQLQKQQQQKERVSSTRRRTTSNSKVTTCQRCGGTNAEGSRYCNNCGFRFADTNAGITNQRPSSAASVVTMSPSSPSIKTSQQDVNSFKTCELPAYGVKINYPSKWRVGKGPTPSTFVIFQSPKENPSDILFESVGISSYDIIAIETLEQLMQGVINYLGKKHHDFTLIESVPTILAGRQAHRIVYDAGGKRYMGTVTIEKNKAYQVIYVAEP